MLLKCPTRHDRRTGFLSPALGWAVFFDFRAPGSLPWPEFPRHQFLPLGFGTAKLSGKDLNIRLHRIEAPDLRFCFLTRGATHDIRLALRRCSTNVDMDQHRKGFIYIFGHPKNMGPERDLFTSSADRQN